MKKRLVSRNLETQEVKDLGITGSRYSFVDPYVESLVLKFLIASYAFLLTERFPIEPCSWTKQFINNYCLVWVVKK